VCDEARELRPQTGEQVREFFLRRMDRYQVVALEGQSEPIHVSPLPWYVFARRPPPEHRTGLVTGYFEPVFEGSRSRTEPFVVPVYRAPKVLPSATRSELESSGALEGQELLWLRDPMEAFVLQVQGSGRIHLSDGTVVRLAYAASNGQPYRSIGRWLVDQGELNAQDLSLPAILDWAHAHPQRVSELLDQNPRVVFFRELPLGDPGAGPVGTLGVALTPGVSVAVDARCLPLGAPLLLQTDVAVHGDARAHLVVAQDTGSAIRGALRIDWFWGPGPQAAQVAGSLRARASVQLLVPRGVSPWTLL